MNSFDGNYRKATDEINTFIARINRMSGVTAAMIVEPLDVRTSATITATDVPVAATRPEAHFVLKLVRSMKAPRQ